MEPNHGREINMVTAARGPAWSPKGMAIRSGAGNSLSGHSQNQTTTRGLLSTHRVFPLFRYIRHTIFAVLSAIRYLSKCNNIV